LSEHPAAAQADPGVSLAGQLCAACGGGCCNAGGDTAFLTVTTIRRFMAANPRLRPRDVLASYLDRLQQRTQRGSCVSQTESGCGLPRDMRSDTCNNWYCAPQIELRDQRPTRVAGALVVVRRQGEWTKAEPGLPNEIIRVVWVTA
jgi:hypothetical protein